MSQGQIRDKDKPEGQTRGTNPRDNFGNVPVLEGQTRECPYVPEVSLETRTNPRMSLRNRITMHV
nr:MAG TPA: hypothetical protein [Caudoviricetes sp.]